MDKNLIPGKVVIIGASTGGPVVIEEIVKKLPRHLKATIIVVQHLFSQFTRNFADRLRHVSLLSIHEATGGDILISGSALLLKGDKDFKIEKENSRYVLYEYSSGEEEKTIIKPNIDLLLISAAENFGKEVIAVVLSGMGDDGLKGAKAVKEKGGVVIIEDKESSIVYGMPGKIQKAKLCDFILTPGEIAEKIIELTS